MPTGPSDLAVVHHLNLKRRGEPGVSLQAPDIQILEMYHAWAGHQDGRLGRLSVHQKLSHPIIAEILALSASRTVNTE